MQHLILFDIAVDSIAATTVAPDETEFEQAVGSRGALTARTPTCSKFEMIVQSIATTVELYAEETVRSQSVETLQPVMTEAPSSAEETSPPNAEFEGIIQQSTAVTLVSPIV